MTAPPQAFYETAQAAADRIDRLRARLRAANEIRRSVRRDRFLTVLDVLASAVDDAVGQDDENELAEVLVDLDEVDDALTWLQEAAPALWSARHAAFVEAVGAMVDGRMPPKGDLRLRGLGMPLLAAWRQAGRKPPVPEPVRAEYALRLVAVGENILRVGVDPFRRVRDQGALTLDDVPDPADAAGRPARKQAELAVRTHLREQALAAAAARAEEEANPGLVRQIWNVFGWESFTDFAFDVGLIVVTGSGAAFARWGRVVVEGTARAGRLTVRARRAARLAEQYRESLGQLDKARDALRLRLDGTRVNRLGQEALEISADRLRRQTRHVLTVLFDLAQQAVQAASARRELAAALAAGLRVVAKVGDAEVGNVLLGRSEIGRILGAGGEDPRVVAIEKIHEISARLGIDAHTDLGRRITDARDALVRSLGAPRAGNQGVLYRRWYMLLVARQIAVRLMVQAAADRGRPISREDLVKVLVKSMVGAFTDSLTDLLPDVRFVRAAGERFIGTVSDLGKDVLAAIVVEALR